MVRAWKDGVNGEANRKQIGVFTFSGWSTRSQAAAVTSALSGARIRNWRRVFMVDSYRDDDIRCLHRVTNFLVCDTGLLAVTSSHLVAKLDHAALVSSNPREMKGDVS